MLFFNNLIFNLHHKEYRPFLFNLLSFRRRILTDSELVAVKSMVEKKEQIKLFNMRENGLYSALLNEKQILNKDIIAQVDARLHQEYTENYKNFYNSTDMAISIQISTDCNMDCCYCFEKKYLKTRHTMTNRMIDNISAFFDVASLDAGVQFNVSSIRLTGGEPLYSQETAKLVSYIAEKWPGTKIILQTNGLNLIKYYDYLPLEQLNPVTVSLDGIPDIHAKRRFSSKTDNSFYSDILNGIKRLLGDGVQVAISSVLDKSNYIHYGDFENLLKEEGLLGHPLIVQLGGVVCDFATDLCIDTRFNNKFDVMEIHDFITSNTFKLQKHGAGLFQDLATINEMLLRETNAYSLPKTYRCNGVFFNNQLFATDGNVYLCERVVENKGIVGTFFPKISIDFNRINEQIQSNPIFTNEQCKACVYKYVCHGGCLMVLYAKDKKIDCGSFYDNDIMDRLSYDYKQ